MGYSDDYRRGELWGSFTSELIGVKAAEETDLVTEAGYQVLSDLVLDLMKDDDLNEPWTAGSLRDRLTELWAEHRHGVPSEKPGD